MMRNNAFTRQTALDIISSMKGKEFIIDGGEVERFETGSVAPATGKTLLMTNKKSRETTLSSFEEHIKLYVEYKRPVARPTTPVEQPRSGVNVNLPAHVGTSKDVICFTTDHALFKNIKGNRELSEVKIKRIIKDIDGGLNLLPFCPIIVDAQMNIIDGQHRFEVCIRINSPVWFIVARKLSLHEIAKVNSNQERWKAKDFIHCYAELGNTHYIKLKEFIENYNIPVSIGINLLMGKNPDAGATNFKSLFEQGEFKSLHEEEAILVMEKAMLFDKFAGWRTGAFIQAIVKLIAAGELCDWSHLLKKYTANPEALPSCSGYKQYLVELERIYNQHASKRKNIY